MKNPSSYLIFRLDFAWIELEITSIILTAAVAFTTACSDTITAILEEDDITILTTDASKKGCLFDLKFCDQQ